MSNYSITFTVALFINLIVTFRSSALYTKYLRWISSGSRTTTPTSSGETISAGERSKHTKLLTRYLIVYLLATLSDWLQGPYVYALYDAYGYSQHDIAVLFVAGFGSSMIFGSFVGGMADAGGRRNFVVLFALIYGASCLTKHVKDFNVLLVGRLLGGIATSLLFSVFDSWLIRAHSIAKVDKSLLSQSFSTASYGNSIIAILAGLVANRAANASSLHPLSTAADAKVYIGGYIAPFDIAFVALVLCGSMALFLWEENYGESMSTSSSLEQSDDGRDGTSTASAVSGLGCFKTMHKAYTTTIRNRNILFCGIISSLFEGSMYVFVFMWTPCLTSVSQTETLPFGLIFSTFMVSCMAGSSLFSIFITKYRAERISVVVFLVAAFCFLAITLTNSDTVTFIAMNIFEVGVGMYFPSMGTMKSSIVPETQRAAIYNLYRIPLNFIVLTSLLTNLTPRVSFIVCFFMLLTASALQLSLLHRRDIESPAPLSKVDLEPLSEGIDEKEEAKGLLMGMGEVKIDAVGAEKKSEAPDVSMV